MEADFFRPERRTDRCDDVNGSHLQMLRTRLKPQPRTSVDVWGDSYSFRLSEPY